MRNSLEKPFRIKRAVWQPAGTGSQKIHRLLVTFEYTGVGQDQVCEFLTSVGQGMVEAKFSVDPEDNKWLTVHGKFQRAGIGLPSKRDERGRIAATFALAKDDIREMRELLVFLTEAARVEALEVETRFELFQAELPLEGAGDMRNAS